MMAFYDAAQAGAVGALVLTALAVMGSPGPSTTSLVASVVAFGMRRSLTYGTGLVLGAIVVLLATATGITAVLLAVPVIHTALLIVAVAYILWLAYRLATAPPLHEPQASTGRSPTFVDGIVLGVINPKAWIAISAVFTSARLAGAVSKVAILSLMVVFIHAIWLLAGGLLMPALRHPRRGRAVNITLAGLLVVTSVAGLLS